MLSACWEHLASVVPSFAFEGELVPEQEEIAFVVTWQHRQLAAEQ